MRQERNLKRRKGSPSSFFPSSSSQSSLLANDRISTLPDPILHDIFSLLPTKSIARTATLSKRFNDLWLTYPIMDVNEYDHSRQKKSDKLVNRMQRTYASHDFSFLEKLKFRARQPIRKVVNENLCFEVERFIWRAVHADTLKELQIEFPVSKKPPTVGDLSNLDMFHRRFFLLPAMYVFSYYKSLKFLKLKGCRFQGNSNMNYDGIRFPVLEELVIKYCEIPDNNFVTNFIDGCPQLEKVLFKFFLPGRKIQFSSPKLKELVFGCYANASSFEIEAPNLQRFKLAGTQSKHTLDGGVWYRPRFMICFPNLETLSFQHIRLNHRRTNLLLSSLKTLKDLRISSSVFRDEPKFESESIEKLEIFDCKFEDVNLFISSSKLPKAKLVYLYSCTGLRNLTLHSRDLVFKAHACQAFRKIHKINI